MYYFYLIQWNWCKKSNNRTSFPHFLTVVLTPSLTALAVLTVVSRRPFVLSNLLLYTFNLQHFHFWVIYDETSFLFTYLHNPFFPILELSNWWKTCTRFPLFQTSPKERRRSKLQMRRSQSMDLDDHHEETEESEAKVFKLLSETDIQVEATLELAGYGQSVSESVSHTFRYHDCDILKKTIFCNYMTFRPCLAYHLYCRNQD